MLERSQDEIKEIMIGRHLEYMKEHDLVPDGDITGIVITKVRDDNSEEEFMYILMSIPVKNADGSDSYSI